MDLNALSRERTRWEVNCKAGKEGDAEVDVARKNLAIVLKRIDKLQEIKRYMGVARGQLDLIDNSFQLIADQIVTMQSPQQLSGQLDELLDGVESIRPDGRATPSASSAPSATGRIPMSPTRLLPPWADDLRRRYARGEASMFVLHGNVYDGVLDGTAAASR